MRQLLYLCCFVAVCSGLKQEERMADRMHRSFKMLHHRYVRGLSPEMQFLLIDNDFDGEATPDEFAKYFAKRHPEHTYEYWKAAVEIWMEPHDKNKNGSLDLNEYRAVVG